MALELSSHRRWSALAVVLLACGGLVACGDDDNGDSASTTGTGASTSGAATTPTQTTPAGAASTRLALVAEESNGLRFDRRTLRARAGDVTIVMDNPSANAQPHAVEIEGGGVEEESATIEPGAAPTEVRANLRPGTYTFYCPVGGHRQAGMEGTLTVG